MTSIFAVIRAAENMRRAANLLEWLLPAPVGDRPRLVRFRNDPTAMPLRARTTFAKRPPAPLAGDRFIQLSYLGPLSIFKFVQTFGNSKARVVARIRETGHFFRFVFAEKFSGDRNSRILSEMARPAGLVPVRVEPEARDDVPEGCRGQPTP